MKKLTLIVPVIAAFGALIYKTYKMKKDADAAYEAATYNYVKIAGKGLAIMIREAEKLPPETVKEEIDDVKGKLCDALAAMKAANSKYEETFIEMFEAEGFEFGPNMGDGSRKLSMPGTSFSMMINF